ncbi:MAG: DUF2971 domain-containing protein [Planctomycetota bacterium]|nr:DUF2971 domain-containing protein [Planctomycetota bacterium]
MQEQVEENFLARRRNMGVFSMTEDSENILMWSHYAADHTGFCLEFRTENAFFSFARRVEYDIALPCVDMHEPMWGKLIGQGAGGLLTKTQDWVYEKEWRIVEVNGVGIHRYPSDALSGVILGCKMLPDKKKQIKDWLGVRNPRPSLYEAKEKDHEFGLDIVLICS